MTFHPSISALVAIVAAIPSAALATEPLQQKDRDELKALSTAFFADLVKGDQTHWAKYVEDVSLRKYMALHRIMIGKYVARLSPAQFAELFTLVPDAKTVLQEQDPVKYFAGIRGGRALSGIAASANVINTVVGITGDSQKAYIVLAGKFDGDLGKTEPNYSVWPAIHTPDGWRLDITSNVVRDFASKAAGPDPALDGLPPP